MHDLNKHLQDVEKYIQKMLQQAKQPQLDDPQYDDPEIWHAQNALANIRALDALFREMQQALRWANELINMEPYEHSSQEASEAHDKIRELMGNEDG